MVKKVSLIALIGFSVSLPVSAYWGDGWGGYNSWPTWTPMYWMEEMFDSVDDDGYGYRPWGGRRYGGYPQWGYGSAPYYPPYYAQRGFGPYYGYQMPYYQSSPYGYMPYAYPPAVPVR